MAVKSALYCFKCIKVPQKCFNGSVKGCDLVHVPCVWSNTIILVFEKSS